MARDRGVSLLECLAVVACLGIMFGSAASLMVRQAAVAADAEAYTQAVLAAEQALEWRRAKGRFPQGAELERLRSAIGLDRAPAVATREERFRGTPLAQATVTVTWRSSPGTSTGRREVRLTSLIRGGR